MEKITLSEVFKKDLKVVGFLLINGGVALVSQTLLKENQQLSILLGAVANYIAFRVQQELSGEGYREALK